MYVYFSVFIGFALIVLSVLFVLGERNKLRGVLAMLLWFFAGLEPSLLSTMAAPGVLDAVRYRNDGLHQYMESGMVIPTALLVLLAGEAFSSWAISASASFLGPYHSFLFQGC